MQGVRSMPYEALQRACRAVPAAFSTKSLGSNNRVTPKDMTYPKRNFSCPAGCIYLKIHCTIVGRDCDLFSKIYSDFRCTRTIRRELQRVRFRFLRFAQ